MLLVDRLVEEHIENAIRRGEFDDLPGQGEPLNLDNEDAVPEALRVAYRVLRNAGCVPPELALRNEIRELEGMLHQLERDGERQSVRARLSLLQARLGEVNLWIRDRSYRDQVISRLADESDGESR